MEETFLRCPDRLSCVVGKRETTEKREKAYKRNESSERLPNYVKVLTVTDVNGRRKRLYIPAALDLERPKRPRTMFTERQLRVLERQFEDDHFVGETQRQRLALELGLTETQIKVWFQNRRTKCRRLGECQPGSLSQGKGFFIPGTGTTPTAATTTATAATMSRDKFMLPTTRTGLKRLPPQILLQGGTPLLGSVPLPQPQIWSPYLPNFTIEADTNTTTTTARNPPLNLSLLLPPPPPIPSVALGNSAKSML